MTYKVALIESEERGSLSVASVPGCCSQGATEAEVREVGGAF
jgi:predicted RNase H-like HicB family nuclease